MPSLPTSLIIVGLVVAWLVVLVPMVAKRREHVPDDIDEGANFRVLQRDSASRRRPVFSRTAMAHRTRGDSGVDGDAGGDSGGDSGFEGDARGGANVRDNAVEYDAAAAEASGAEVVDVAAAPEPSVSDEVDDALRLATDAAVDERVDVMAVPAAAPQRDDRMDDEDRYAGRARGPRRAEADDSEYRRTPIRQGRGGFDPEAADRAQAYRFRRRQRIALLLLVLALAGAAVGYLGTGYGYAASALSGVLLVLYLAYLRRQVRIENEIRRRRAARLVRARQIRPGYRPSVAEQVYAHRTGEFPRPGQVDGYQVRSHVHQSVPPSGFGYGEPVDLDDSDPAFDDLEYYRPAAYRRRAG